MLSSAVFVVIVFFVFFVLICFIVFNILVYGAMRCLALLSADLDDKIVPTLIPALFPCLLTIVSSPQVIFHIIPCHLKSIYSFTFFNDNLVLFHLILFFKKKLRWRLMITGRNFVIQVHVRTYAHTHQSVSLIVFMDS